jgi:hypothetical protein
MGGLSGMKEIARHCNRSEATILGWIRDRAFPAVKITGSWESDTEIIDQWRKNQINDAILRRTNKNPPKRSKKW